MDYNELSKEDLIGEIQILSRELEELRREQIDLGQLSSFIRDRKRTEQQFRKINDALLSLGSSFDENVNLLTRLCGELTGATCTLYNRLQDGMLVTLGQWNAPPDFCSTNNPDGHICYDVIKNGGNQVIIIQDLPKTPYALSDPGVSAYNLITYIGKAVVCDGQFAGSICAVFQSDVILTLEHVQIFTIIASALGNEESRKIVQKSLRDSEERFRSAFLTNPDAININRLSDGLYVDINEGFTKITGYTWEDVIGKTSLQLNVWDNPRDRQWLVDGLRKNGYVENLEALFRLKNGGTKTAVMSARIFNINGEPHILSVTRDMTDWKKAMLAIQESEHKFRSVVENAFDGIYLISGDRFIYTNQRFCEIMAYSAEEMTSEEFNFGTTLTVKSRELVEQRRQARIRG